MRYDLTLKDLFQNLPRRLLQLLTGSDAAQVFSAEYPSVAKRLPDLVLRLTDGRLYHLELQSDNDADMALRMLESAEFIEILRGACHAYHHRYIRKHLVSGRFRQRLGQRRG